MTSVSDWLRSVSGPAATPQSLAAIAREREATGELHHAAAALDAAYGLDPENEPVATARAELLERLAVTEHGLRFRYVPAGKFLMGSLSGDPDEQPLHPVELEPFWLTDIPVTWADYCRLLGWSAPPEGRPPAPPAGDEELKDEFFSILIMNQIRLQYCETETTRALDWHAHDPTMRWGDKGQKTSAEIFGLPPRRNPDAPWSWDQKPMVAAAWQDAEELAERLFSADVRYGLPTEAEWEKAARGGLVGCAYSWGAEPPTPERCDFNRWNEFSLRVPRELPPNRYGLYGMCGGVWEWTADWYDAGYYGESPRQSPTGPAEGEERVLRGGSWTDCAEAVTVSFRMSGMSTGRRERARTLHRCPNFGFRLVRREVSASTHRQG